MYDSFRFFWSVYYLHLNQLTFSFPFISSYHNFGEHNFFFCVSSFSTYSQHTISFFSFLWFIFLTNLQLPTCSASFISLDSSFLHFQIPFLRYFQLVVFLSPRMLHPLIYPMLLIYLFSFISLPSSYFSRETFLYFSLFLRLPSYLSFFVLYSIFMTYFTLFLYSSSFTSLLLFLYTGDLTRSPPLFLHLSNYLFPSSPSS